MDFIWAILIFVGIWALTTILTGFLGLLIPIIYVLLGFILGTESIILGIGGLLGSLFNIYSTSRYIKTQGALSHAPIYGRIASIGYIIVFTATIIARYIFDFELYNINYWYLILFAFIAWLILSLTIKKRRTQSLDNFKENASKYKIVAKYEDDPIRSCPDTKKLEGIGWRPKILLEDGIIKTISWIKKNYL